MREIKFRGFGIFEWVYGSLVGDGDKLYIVEEIENHGGGTDLHATVWSEVSTESVGEFTGLNDKNGKEIYEGDIVQYKHYYAIKRWWRNMNEIPEIEKRVQEQRDNYVIEKQHIVFADGGFYLGYDINGRDIDRGEKYKKGSGNASDFEEKYWDFEVIGNIYENPELIQS